MDNELKSLERDFLIDPHNEGIIQRILNLKARFGQKIDYSQLSSKFLHSLENLQENTTQSLISIEDDFEQTFELECYFKKDDLIFKTKPLYLKGKYFIHMNFEGDLMGMVSLQDNISLDEEIILRESVSTGATYKKGRFVSFAVTYQRIWYFIHTYTRQIFFKKARIRIQRDWNLIPKCLSPFKTSKDIFANCPQCKVPQQLKKVPKKKKVHCQNCQFRCSLKELNQMFDYTLPKR